MFSIEDFRKKHIKKSEPLQPFPVEEEKEERAPPRERRDLPVAEAPEPVPTPKKVKRRGRPRKVKTVEPVAEPVEEIKTINNLESMKNDFLNSSDKMEFLKKNKDNIRGMSKEDRKSMVEFFKDFTKQ